LGEPVSDQEVQALEIVRVCGTDRVLHVSPLCLSRLNCSLISLNVGQSQVGGIIDFGWWRKGVREYPGLVGYHS
jgi:hypothetical protein